MSQDEAAPARPLYDEVERIRLRNGWTKVQLAKRAGVGRNTIDNWRTQPRAPLAPTVKDVAERLGIDAEMALRLAGIVPMGEPTPRVDRYVELHDSARAEDDLTVKHAAPATPESRIEALAARVAEVERVNAELQRELQEFRRERDERQQSQGKAG